MTTRIEKQTNWAAGELAPELHGQTDKEFYRAGARALENFYVTKHGALINRPGTQSTIFALNSYHSLVRCVPWTFSASDSLVLVFTDLKFIGIQTKTSQERTEWVYGGDGSSQGDDLPGNTTTPWTSSQLADLRFVQLGNIMLIMSPDTVTYKLTRTVGSPDTWTFEPLNLVPMRTILDPGWITPPASPTGATRPASNVWHGLFVRTGEEAPNVSGDTALKPALWSYAVQWILRLSDGRVVSTKAELINPFYLNLGALVGTPWNTTLIDATLAHFMVPSNIVADGGANPTRLLLPEEIAVGANQKRTIFIGWDPALTAGPFTSNTGEEGLTAEILASRIFRGRQGSFGLVGETTEMWFVDDGHDPDYSIRPALSKLRSSEEEADQFSIYENGAFVRTEYPVAGVFHEARLVLAATAQRPGQVWFSESNNFYNFLEPPLRLGGWDAPFSYAPAESSNILELVSANGLIIFASSAIYRAAGSNDSVLHVSDILVHEIDGHGAANVPTVKAGDTIFYVGTDGRSVMAFRPTGDNRFYNAQETNILSSHLTEGRTIIRMAYARRPHGILWVVLDNGDLLSMTWQPENNVVAWAKHTTPYGTVEDVCVIPETGEDGVYLIVRRQIGNADQRLLERLAYRQLTDLRDAIFLDSSSSFQSTAVAGETVTLTNVTVIPLTEELGAGDTEVTCTFDAGSGSQDEVIALLDPDGIEAPVFIQVMAAWNANAQTGVVRNPPLPDWALTASLSYYRVATTLTGLGHLNGQEVAVVADGDFVAMKTVTGGAVSIEDERPFGATSIHAGLPYNSDFDSLDSTVAEGAQKIVRSARIKLSSARGGKVGPDFDNLVEVQQRHVDQGWARLPLGVIEETVPIQASFTDQGRVVFRQDEPFPVTLTSIIREIADGGR